jgi:hypothetical protein
VVSRARGWPGYVVTVTEVVVWMMDSYDFEGYQDLGWWNEEHNSVLRGPLPDSKYYTQVTNKTFRDWRDKNSRVATSRFSQTKTLSDSLGRTNCSCRRQISPRPVRTMDDGLVWL